MFLIISNQILKMLLILIVGFLCSRTGMIDQQGNKTLSNLLLMVINPILIVNAFLADFSPELLRGFGYAFLLAMLTHIAAIVVVRFIFPKEKDPDWSISRFSTIYSNCGFMGIPLAGSILGNEGILYITAYMIAFNILVWTQGVALMTGDFSTKQLKKGLTSPVMCSIVIGFVLFLVHPPLPEILTETIGMLSDLNTPLAMLIAGVALAETEFSGLLQNRFFYRVLVTKLLILPAIMLAVFLALPLPFPVLCTILLASACPTATTGTMFALRYDANYKYASQIFTVSTVLSILTIPGVVWLAERFLS